MTLTSWLKARRDRPPRPTGDANPFEAYLLTACALVGLLVIAGAAQPRSVELLLPPWLRTIWAVLIGFGGILTVVGLYWPGDPFTGVEIKRVGLTAAGVGTLAWGTAAAFYGIAGIPTAISNLAFSLACAVRVGQVSRRIRFARQHLRAVRLHAGIDGEQPGGHDRGDNG